MDVIDNSEVNNIEQFTKLFSSKFHIKDTIKMFEDIKQYQLRASGTDNIIVPFCQKMLNNEAGIIYTSITINQYNRPFTCTRTIDCPIVNNRKMHLYVFLKELSNVNCKMNDRVIIRSPNNEQPAKYCSDDVPIYPRIMLFLNGQAELEFNTDNLGFKQAQLRYACSGHTIDGITVPPLSQPVSMSLMKRTTLLTRSISTTSTSSTTTAPHRFFTNFMNGPLIVDVNIPTFPNVDIGHPQSVKGRQRDDNNQGNKFGIKNLQHERTTIRWTTKTMNKNIKFLFKTRRSSTQLPLVRKRRAVLNVTPFCQTPPLTDGLGEIKTEITIDQTNNPFYCRRDIVCPTDATTFRPQGLQVRVDRFQANPCATNDRLEFLSFSYGKQQFCVGGNMPTQIYTFPEGRLSIIFRAYSNGDKFANIQYICAPMQSPVTDSVPQTENTPPTIGINPTYTVPSWFTNQNGLTFPPGFTFTMAPGQVYNPNLFTTAAFDCVRDKCHGNADRCVKTDFGEDICLCSLGWYGYDCTLTSPQT
ncbi:hypothetical protein SNEBB_002602 [Seison nebaliae]|nr:hypothetical protein SNEBB_002602 [Seison nebaliae]